MKKVFFILGIALLFFATFSVKTSALPSVLSDSIRINGSCLNDDMEDVSDSFPDYLVELDDIEEYFLERVKSTSIGKPKAKTISQCRLLNEIKIISSALFVFHTDTSPPLSFLI